MTSPARSAALEAIAAARRRDAYVAPLVERAVRRRRLQEPDRALAVALAKGVVRTRGALDETIARFTALERLEPLVLDVLRLGTFELLYLRTPPHAAVDEAVGAMRTRRPQAARLANAVLRRIAEASSEFPWGDPRSDPDALARLYGCPRWLVDAFVSDLGSDAASDALASLAAEPPLYARVNPLLADRETALAAVQREGVRTCPAPPDELSFRALDPAAFARCGPLERDEVFVCDAAAQYVALQAVVGGAVRVVEIGAGRGTKTIAIIGAFRSLGDSPTVIAIEPHASRARVLAERIARTGFPSLETVVSDVRSAHSATLARAAADVVIVDAPCTGTGTLRRHPEAVWRLAPGDAMRLSALQQEILAAAAQHVRDGGVLVYSTCSVLKAENEDVVAAFLASRTGARFRLASLDPDPPQEWMRFVTPDGFFRSWPSPEGPDGHFVVRMRASA